MKLTDIESDISVGGLVYVEYEDVTSCTNLAILGSSWSRYDDDEAWQPVRIKISGFLLHLGSDRIAVTPQVSLNDPHLVETPTIIPMGCIKKLEGLARVIKTGPAEFKTGFVPVEELS